MKGRIECAQRDHRSQSLGPDRRTVYSIPKRKFSSFLALASSKLIPLPYPSVSSSPFAGRNSDHGPSKTHRPNPDHARLCNFLEKEKLRPWSKFLGRENSDHGLSFGSFLG